MRDVDNDAAMRYFKTLWWIWYGIETFEPLDSALKDILGKTAKVVYKEFVDINKFIYFHSLHMLLKFWHGPLSWLVDNLATMSIGASVLPIRSPYYSFRYQNDNNKHIFSQSEEALQICDVQMIPK